jgi:hypothetical protein
MIGIASLGRHSKFAGKGCTRLQFNGVAAPCGVQCRLEVTTLGKTDYVTRRW